MGSAQLQHTYMKPCQVQNESFADSLDLGGDNWQHWGVDAIELIEATPRSTLGKAREDLTHSLRTKRGFKDLHSHIHSYSVTWVAGSSNNAMEFMEKKKSDK